MFAGLVINPRKTCCGERLKNVEVRAGLETLPKNHRGKINKNKICNTFEGPGEDGKVVTIRCDSLIKADYITVQILGNDSILEVNEMDLIIPTGSPYTMHSGRRADIFV